jgi:transcriptional regulator with XRE-family HTH domain
MVKMDIKDLRLSISLNKVKVAKRIGVSISLYDKVERKERLPSRKFLKKVKDSFPDFDMNIFFADSKHETCIKKTLKHKLSKPDHLTQYQSLF